ncbi:MAG: hypothetical protein LC104_03495 [Bacteroidales bacterium]|nr:hypothetical protein [Bacteroidales bacterium]
MTSLLLSLALTTQTVTPAQMPFPPGFASPPAPLTYPTPLSPAYPAPVAGVPSMSLFPAPPMTHQQFAAIFQPIPGTHKVVLLHPKTGQPVEVCFTLPPGCPKVNVGRRYLEFDYGRVEVEIRFGCCGRVKVDYDD